MEWIARLLANVLRVSWRGILKCLAKGYYWYEAVAGTSRGRMVLLVVVILAGTWLVLSLARSIRGRT